MTDVSRLHPEDLKALKEVVENVVRARPLADESGMRRIMREEIDRDRTNWLEQTRAIVHEEQKGFIEKELPKVFLNIGLPIDDDHIMNTRRTIDAMFRARVGAGVVVTEALKQIGSMLGLVILAFLGWKAMSGGH